jgi:hypothetical protein
MTKLRQYFRIPWVRQVRPMRPKQPPPDEGPGSAGVPAKLQPVTPSLSGANAKAFPPVEDDAVPLDVS